MPKNGLPKNGQAGISSKKKNDPRLEKWVKNGFTTHKQRLLWRRLKLLRRHCWLRNVSTSTVWNISAAFPARLASSRTVCTLQGNLHDSETDWKIRTRLAGGVKNKNDPGWDRLPPPPPSSAPDSTVMMHQASHNVFSSIKGKCILSNVGGQTGKGSLFTWTDGVESRRSSGSNPQKSPLKALHLTTCTKGAMQVAFFPSARPLHTCLLWTC